ncbi:hypothetical protein [Bacillus salipaludis]|uniref:Uncharacterized protein n=1 Tax=Bacillus salipaludis TaxID=2547811 RepID=A0AA90Z565_9BACI|nr:hypothetical protein [Bacillus salipaludis]MDQ6600743.1 hypothetical protein [Bacillus salipaludis]
MTNSISSVLTFHIKSSTLGKFKAKVTVRDQLALEKTFEAVKLDLNLKDADGSIINLQILPKIKDDKGNVYCDLDEEGEQLLRKYIGLQD